MTKDYLENILDSDLNAWIKGNGDDTREVIVEANVPSRTVRMGESRTQRHIPQEVVTAGGGDRAMVLKELQDYLSSLLGNTVSVLRAAGAIAVRANREQLREIAKHPKVKAVRVNRRLKPGSVV